MILTVEEIKAMPEFKDMSETTIKRKLTATKINIINIPTTVYMITSNK